MSSLCDYLISVILLLLFYKKENKANNIRDGYENAPKLGLDLDEIERTESTPITTGGGLKGTAKTSLTAPKHLPYHQVLPSGSSMHSLQMGLESPSLNNAYSSRDVVSLQGMRNDNHNDHHNHGHGHGATRSSSESKAKEGKRLNELCS